MKLIDGIKLKGGKGGMMEIPDCGRTDLPNFFVEMGYKVGAEVGVYMGEFTKLFCEAGLYMYAVDPWLIYKDYHAHRGQKRFDSIYGTAKKRLAPYSNCEIVRKMSVDAAEDFEDESLDFVYIDGHHGLKFVVEDIYAWSKKVRKGGVISGHDYGVNNLPVDHPQVMQVKYAVGAYTRAFKIDPWYVLGSKRPKEGETRDKWRSWMWIKP